jgi:hypothetical protein
MSRIMVTFPTREVVPISIYGGWVSSETSDHILCINALLTNKNESRCNEYTL